MMKAYTTYEMKNQKKLQGSLGSPKEKKEKRDRKVSFKK